MNKSLKAHRERPRPWSWTPTGPMIFYDVNRVEARRLERRANLLAKVRRGDPEAAGELRRVYKAWIIRPVHPDTPQPIPPSASRRGGAKAASAVLTVPHSGGASPADDSYAETAGIAVQTETPTIEEETRWQVRMERMTEDTRFTVPERPSSAVGS